MLLFPRHFPENAELCTALGLLHLQNGSHAPAFEQLGNAMAFEPSNSKAVLAAGSVAQASITTVPECYIHQT